MARPRSQRRKAVAGARSLKLGAEDKLNAHGFSPDAERYRTLFEGSHVGMAFVAPDGTVLEVNPAACELWGRSAEELVGMPGTELPHPDDLAGALAGMERLREGAIDALRAERRYVRPDGSTVWVDLTLQAVRGPDGEILYLQALLMDTTERKRAQEDQARLAAIVQSSQDAIIGSRLDSVITSWNPGAERLYGYTAEEVIGRRGEFLLPPDQRDESAGLMARIPAGQRLNPHRTQR